MTAQTFEKPDYKTLCEEYRNVSQIRKEAEKQEKDLKVLIIEEAGGERMEYGVNVSIKERKGSYDMKLLQQAYGISDEELEGFRKESSTYWDVRGY